MNRNATKAATLLMAALSFAWVLFLPDHMGIVVSHIGIVNGIVAEAMAACILGCTTVGLADAIK